MPMKMHRGDHPLWAIQFKDLSGEPIDISESVVVFSLKASEHDEGDIVRARITEHPDAASGITRLALSPEDADLPPGTYHFRFLLIDKLGRKQVVEQGAFEVEGEDDRILQ